MNILLNPIAFTKREFAHVNKETKTYLLNHMTSPVCILHYVAEYQVFCWVGNRDYVQSMKSHFRGNTLLDVEI